MLRPWTVAVMVAGLALGGAGIGPGMWAQAAGPASGPAPAVPAHTRPGPHAGASRLAKTLRTPVSWLTLKDLNPAITGYHKLSHFITGMGDHMGQLAPSLVVMINHHDQVTGVETAFPQVMGYQQWFDPPTREPNAGVAMFSQHIYFLHCKSITPAMPATLKSGLGSWRHLQGMDPDLASYRELKPFKPGVGSVWGPPGPGIRLLRDRSGHAVVGAMAGFPAKYGWQRWFDQPQGQPVRDPMLGNVYTQTLHFVPPGAVV